MAKNGAKIFKYILALVITAAALAGGVVVLSNPLDTAVLTPEGVSAPSATPSPSGIRVVVETQPPKEDGPGALMAEVIDVGKGDSILVTLPTGEAMLVDTAEPDDAHHVLDALSAHGVSALDYLVLTHPHSDHIGGAQDVLDACQVKNVVMPRASHTTKLYRNLLERLDSSGVPVTEAKAGLTLSLGEAALEFVSPTGEEHENINEYSAVFTLEYKGTRMLFCGDMETPNEKEVLRSGYDVDCDIIKVAHHGSQTSSSQAFIDAVSPDYALISCLGPENKTPNEKVQERFSEAGAKVLRTDLEGDIYVYAGEDGYTVKGTGK